VSPLRGSGSIVYANPGLAPGVTAMPLRGWLDINIEHLFRRPMVISAMTETPRGWHASHTDPASLGNFFSCTSAAARLVFVDHPAARARFFAHPDF
jgi:hypothetical protein